MSFIPTPCYDDTCDVQTQAQTKTMTMTLSHLTARLSGLMDWIKRASSVYRQRRQLSQLSPRELADMGIRREDAQRECARLFWDLPDDKI